jgi:hypothetical protein
MTSVTVTATIYHRHFEDPDQPGERYELGADLGMGYEFATEERGIDIGGVFDEAYEQAGTVTISVGPSDDPHATAYSAWEDGRGHAPMETRSMAVGDIIVVDGVAKFVDRIGFETVDVPLEADA